MQNYHRHSSYGNIYTVDSAVSNEDYAKRAVELGHKIISSVEHGWQGYYYETFELAQKYGLKFIFGTEAYWVKDRHEKDKTNCHIVILAKNEKGRRAINSMLSIANEDGYYFRPRVDLELLLSLPKDDVFVTTACIAFWKYENSEEMFIKLKEHFGDNIMLEIQYHNTPQQIELNKQIGFLALKTNTQMIVGLDSHYIYPEQEQERKYLLESKKVFYEDEEGWYMDYPDDDAVMKRFLEQGVFTESQIRKAMDNTNICLTFDDIVFNKDIKLVSLYPEKTQKERNKIYCQLITKKFKEYTKDFSEKEKKRYYDGVKKEVQTYINTGMVDYPLMDYEIVKRAVENGGLITDSGRGSAVGYFTNSLCGFSKVDRFQSPIKLYPERFISESRILETHSLPDLDLNLGNVEVFAKAQDEVLTEKLGSKGHSYPMIAFGTAKKKESFKLYARAKNMESSLANEISRQIGNYEEDYKNADDDDKDSINIYDYVDKEYHEYIAASEKYWGIITDKKKAPCAYLVYSGDIPSEIGLIKCKSESTKKEYITAVVDGSIAENYKFLKNDLLKVDVVLIIDKLYKRIGIKHHTVSELSELIKDDKKVWEIYARGLTVGINQCEKAGTTKKAMKFKPKNISELAAFIAAIRPAFKSMYSKFESREHFEYGIKAFDRILQTEEFPESFILYQEQTMNTLNYAGFPLDECYGIIKAIAKKHPEKVKPLRARFIEGFKKRIMEDDKVEESKASEMSSQVWQIISDSCGYGFNCVSGDTVMKKSGNNGGFCPTVEEMYKIKNDKYYAKRTGHYSLHKKYNTFGYGFALSMFDDKLIRQNRIVDIVPAGYRQTYKVLTKSGKSIICTSNHKFPTPNGEIKLENLRVGDELYCMGDYIPRYFDSTLTDGNFEFNYPHKGQCGFQKKPCGESSKFQNKRDYNVKNKCKCECCGCAYSEDKNFELHHKDMNRHNNKDNNLIWLCNSCHKKVHYSNGRTKRYGKGIPTYLDKIVSIELYKKETTYDVEMQSPAHTFVSENGLVTSNSAHAYCMALDSLYCAYLKSHYPYEFYEVLMQHYSDKGDKDKVLKLKKEMQEGFGIKEGEYKLGLDNRKFLADKEKGVIYPSLVSIKGISENVANALYEIGDKENLYEFWKSAKKSGIINKGHLEILAKIGYLSKFGNINQVLKAFEIIELFHNRKQIMKNKVPSAYIEVTQKHSRETEKKYCDLDFQAIINECIKTFNDIKTLLSDKLKYQNDYLGYVDYINPKAVGYYFVMDIDTKYSPKVTVYKLDTGETVIYKMSKKDFQIMPIPKNSIVKLVLEKRNKSKIIDGKWIKCLEEFEPWITNYKILK